MKTKVKSTGILLIMVLLVALCTAFGVFGLRDSATANAQEEATTAVGTEGLSFLLNGDEQSYKVRILDKTQKNIIIPSAYNNLPVTAIDDSGFTGCTALEKIIIPSYVTHIGNNAFMRCTNLTKVLGMSGVSSYGNNVFSMCSKLEYLILPSGLTSFGTSVLRNVKANVYSRTLEEDLLQLNAASLSAFSGNIVYGNDLVYERYTDPQTNEEGLSLVSWQNLEMYSDGFNEATTLIVESWHEDTREGISEEEKIEGKVLNIADWAFAAYNSYNSNTECNAENLIIRNTKGYNHSINLESYAFAQTKIKNISIEVNVTFNDSDEPDGVSTALFYANSILQTVNLPDNIEFITKQMFADCKNLRAVNFKNNSSVNRIPETITRIEAEAFYFCHSLPELHIANSITFIGEHAFCNWGTNGDVPQNIYIALEKPSENWDSNWDKNINFTNCNLEFIGKTELTVQFVVEQEGVIDALGGGILTVSRNVTLSSLDLIAPTSENYLFSGVWYTTESRDDGTEFDNDRPVKTDLVLYAGWTIKTFTVTFPQVNGCNFYDLVNSEDIDSQLKLFEYGNAYSFYIETNDGYNNVKIFGNNSLLTPVNGDVYTLNITEDIIISCEYELQIYSITYENLRNGSNPNNITEYTVETDTITFLKPVWDAYDDAHWNIPFIQKGSTGHRVIKAVWENPKEFEVKFIMDDDPNGINRNGNSVKYTVEDAVTIWEPTSLGYTGGEWRNDNDGTRITGWDADTYWKDMTLRVRWGAPKTFEVTLKYKDNNVDKSLLIEATYGMSLPSSIISVPRVKYYKFNGFKSINNGLFYYDSLMHSNILWYQPQHDILEAEFLDNFILVTLEQRGGLGTGGDTCVPMEIGGKWEPIKMPHRLGYYIDGYFDTYELQGSKWQYYDEQGNPLKDIVDLTSNITLIASWHTYSYNFYVDAMTYGASIDGGSSVRITKFYDATVNSNYNYTAPETMEYTYKNGSKAIFGFTSWKIIWRDQAYYDKDTNPWHEITTSRTINVNVGDVLTQYYSHLMNEDGWTYTVRAIYNKNSVVDPGDSGGGCVASGTLITLADGRQVPVEQLKGNESLLVWNLYTGQFDIAPILVIDQDSARKYEIVNLYFSDGTSVKVISEHGFWDCTLNKYVYLDNNASQYIGHWFSKQINNENGQMFLVKVQLINVAITEEYSIAWSPVTYGHLCYYVNGILSMPGGIDGLFNIFEVGEDMKFDSAAMEKDIEIYGLFTYNEISELVVVPEKMFNAVGGQYLKVAVGKGLITIDEIQELVNRYIALFE